MPSNENTKVHHSQPIPIDTHRHARTRSGSVSDDSSSSSDSLASPTSTSPLSSYPITNPKVITPSTSPILSYFFAGQSPKSPAATFPFRRNFGAPVFEDDEPEAEPVGRHARRASTAWPGNERPQQPPPVSGSGIQQDRAAGLLRRLSLGGSLGRPPVPNMKQASGANGAAAMSAAPERTRTPPNFSTAETPRRSRRANTLNPGSRPQRAPSPMGERMLSGHFDGFN